MIEADHRGFAIAAAAGASGGVEPALALALADALVALTASLSDLAYDLGGDADTLRRHMTSLQAIDHITQSQLAIADVLRSSAPVDERLAAVMLDDLAERLRAGRREYVARLSINPG